MQQPLNDAQRKFLLIQRLSIVWKIVAFAVVLVVLYFAWGGHL